MFSVELSTPDAQIFAFQILELSNNYPFMKIVGESSLIDGVIATTWDKYALQMALKLLVAQHVQTEQYVSSHMSIFHSLSNTVVMKNLQ